MNVFPVSNVNTIAPKRMLSIVSLTKASFDRSPSRLASITSGESPAHHLASVTAPRSKRAPANLSATVNAQLKCRMQQLDRPRHLCSVQRFVPKLVLGTQ